MDNELRAEFQRLVERLNWESRTAEEIDRDVHEIIAASVEIYLRPRVPPRPWLRGPSLLFGALCLSLKTLAATDARIEERGPA